MSEMILQTTSLAVRRRAYSKQISPSLGNMISFVGRVSLRSHKTDHGRVITAYWEAIYLTRILAPFSWHRLICPSITLSRAYALVLTAAWIDTLHLIRFFQGFLRQFPSTRVPYTIDIRY